MCVWGERICGNSPYFLKLAFIYVFVCEGPQLSHAGSS